MTLDFLFRRKILVATWRTEWRRKKLEAKRIKHQAIEIVHEKYMHCNYASGNGDEEKLTQKACGDLTERTCFL